MVCTSKKPGGQVTSRRAADLEGTTGRATIVELRCGKSWNRLFVLRSQNFLARETEKNKGRVRREEKAPARKSGGAQARAQRTRAHPGDQAPRGNTTRASKRKDRHSFGLRRRSPGTYFFRFYEIERETGAIRGSGSEGCH